MLSHWVSKQCFKTIFPNSGCPILVKKDVSFMLEMTNIS